ncbi:MAG: peptidylprolyl isomerase [Pirellulaceae bacterium]
MFKKSGLKLGLAALLFFSIGGCGSDSTSTDAPTASISPSGNDSPQRTDDLDRSHSEPSVSGSSVATPEASQKNLHPEVVINTSEGKIRIRLDAEKAPVTVDNFLENYVDRRFYDGTIFHYVEKGFMIIGGGYASDGEVKATRAPIRNESDNGLKNARGTVAMSRQPDYDHSATSQFFINLADNPPLDFVKAKDEEGEDTFGYCVFGVVTEGMDVVDRFAEVAVHDTETLLNTPVQPIVIQSIERVP